MTTARQRLTLRRNDRAGRARPAGRRRPTKKKKTAFVAVGIAVGLAVLWLSSRKLVPSSHEKQGPHSNGQGPQSFCEPNRSLSQCTQETTEPMILGRAAAALPAKLARARPRACRCFFYPLFQTALVRWLGSRRRRPSPAGERKHKGRDRHADCCENRCDSNSLLM